MYGESKAHEDTLIRTLLAIYRYTSKYCPGMKRISLVTGQPIVSHNADEKERLSSMLRGTHNFIVNGEKQTVNIEEVGVAAEGTGAFWSSPQEGEVRIIDVGSGTVNCATMNGGRHINNASETLNFGIETTGNKNDLDGFARGIIRSTTSLKWKRSDKVFLCGGIADELLPYIAFHYDKVRAVTPVLEKHNGREILTPLYANAVGFYVIAGMKYG